MTRMKMSICICTRNRHADLIRCLASIRNNDAACELIVVDQSDQENLNKNHYICDIYQATHVPDSGTGQARSRNIAIRSSHGDIITFTDDDCIVSKQWIKSIQSYFSRNPDIVGVFGSSIPYESKKHIGLFCPASFSAKKTRIFTSPEFDHFSHLGSGNNMSFRKLIIERMGLFKEWLGPGSICINGADDSEYIYRILANKHRLAYHPSIRIWHNRWLNEFAYHKLIIEYQIGLQAFYMYKFLQTKNTYFLKKIFSYRTLLSEKASTIIDSISLGKKLKQNLFFFIYACLAYTRGLTIGVYEFIIDK